ncbi:hypothetical protein ACUTQ5_15765 [Serratia sp. NA_112.1]|uniref:hypothetical protein n=1 Tax=unclassified Serratia (in: enterobacteria) TaxID=2647522 RepID=UPI004046F52C
MKHQPQVGLRRGDAQIDVGYVRRPGDLLIFFTRKPVEDGRVSFAPDSFQPHIETPLSIDMAAHAKCRAGRHDSSCAADPHQNKQHCINQVFIAELLYPARR